MHPQPASKKIKAHKIIPKITLQAEREPFFIIFSFSNPQNSKLKAIIAIGEPVVNAKKAFGGCADSAVSARIFLESGVKILAL